MLKSIVFSDYDGTIYITESDMLKNREAICKYCALGGKFVIVTGRSKKSIDTVIKQYQIPYDYVICNNGSILFDVTGKKLYEQAIPSKISSRIIEYLKSKENLEVLYYDERDKIEYIGQELLKIRIKTFDIELARNIEEEINTIFKREVKAHAAFPSRYYKENNFIIVDVVSQKAGKENAIKRLLEMLAINKEQAITIGDGRNDIAMIKEYQGYTLQTAEEEVKDVASIVFNSVAEALAFLSKE